MNIFYLLEWTSLCFAVMMISQISVQSAETYLTVAYYRGQLRGLSSPPMIQVTLGLNRQLQLQGHSHSGLLSVPKSTFSSRSALFLTVTHSFMCVFLSICLNADLCASPSSPSCRFRSAAWSWPTPFPSWPSGVAVHLLWASPPPVRPLALNTHRVLTLEESGPRV